MDTWQWWWSLVVILHAILLTYPLGKLKGGLYLPGKFSAVCMARDFCELFPPRQHLYIPCTPLYPIQGAWGRAPDLHAVTVVGDVNVGEGGRLSLTSAHTREGSSLPRSCWKWGSSGGGHLRSTSSSTRMVWASSLGLYQSAISCGVVSVCHVGQGN